jgi:adenine-specific DNA-methyltransferase
MSKEQKITNEIKVPNKDLEVLRLNFPHCFDKDGNFQLERFKNNLTEKEVNFSAESYGLEWLGKSYARLLASDPASTLLKADETHNSKPENANSENLLIKGDNLEVLKHLANAYYEQIKMIYIDPPYNTGGDGFVYEDDRKFTVKELQNLIGVDAEKAKRILDFTKQKSNSHSAWLTFIYPRLYIAKQLLKDEGVIFVSIDDNEIAQLRQLMDEIFGEENYVGMFIWRKKEGGGQTDDFFVREHEYIIVYRKSVEFVWKDEEISNNETSFNKEDENGKYKAVKLAKWGTGSRKEDRPTMCFPIKNPDDKNTYPIAPDGNPGRWRVGKARMQNIIDNDLIHWENKNGIYIPYEKVYYDENEIKVIKDRSIIFDETSNTDGANTLTELFSIKDIFENPKPIQLIQFIIRNNTKESDIVLDFFAGSGSTGHGIFVQNQIDFQSRKFILVQIPELINPKKKKVSYDFVVNNLKAEPTIFEITKERLLRAITKTKSTISEKIESIETEIKSFENKLDFDDKDEKIKQLNAEKKSLQKQDLGFKIYETTPIWEDYDFEAEDFDSSQTLFDAGKLKDEDIKALLITWKTYDGIALTQDLENVDLSGYAAYYGNSKLYLMNKGFSTENLKLLLEKIDTDKKFNPTSIICFGYHFESKNLRELSENVKSYSNKKNIDIDFITRY